MNIKIRKEEPKDYRKVEEVAREAFWNLYCPGCNEHLIINTMRNHTDFIPELAFVIEVDDEIVGSIFYTHSKVVSEDGSEHKTMTFGPVSILPDYHRKGLGKALITHSMNEAKKLGCTSIIIGGYPYHYEYLGFMGTKKYGISMPDGNYYTGIMALPLYEGALDGVSGCVYMSDAYEPDETTLNEFDQSFPFKEKKEQESQKEFEHAVSEIDMKNY